MRLSCFYCDRPCSSDLPDYALFRGVVECTDCVESLPTEAEKVILWQAKMVVELFDSGGEHGLSGEQQLELLGRIEQIRRALGKT